MTKVEDLLSVQRSALYHIEVERLAAFRQLFHLKLATSVGSLLMVVFSQCQSSTASGASWRPSLAPSALSETPASFYRPGHTVSPHPGGETGRWWGRHGPCLCSRGRWSGGDTSLAAQSALRHSFQSDKTRCYFHGLAAAFSLSFGEQLRAWEGPKKWHRSISLFLWGPLTLLSRRNSLRFAVGTSS